MQKSTIIIVTLCVLCLSFKAKAHSPDVSTTLLVQQDDNKWVLQIRAALTAFEYVVAEEFGKSSYSTPEEFREMVLKGVKENTGIIFNKNNSVTLSNGLVKLGHETSVNFELEGTVEDLSSLDFANTTFSAIPRNKGALYVVKQGYDREQFILSKDNDYKVSLKVGESAFEISSPTASKKRTYLMYMLLAFSILAFTYFLFKKKQRVVSAIQTQSV